METNYRTVTGDQKAFGWTEDKVIFVDHEIFFYREIFGLLDLLGMQPRNNKKSLMYMLVIMFWKGLVHIPRLGMTVHSLSLYHR